MLLLLREMEPVLPTEALLLSTGPSHLSSILFFTFLGELVHPALLCTPDSASSANQFGTQENQFGTHENQIGTQENWHAQRGSL